MSERFESAFGSFTVRSKYSTHSLWPILVRKCLVPSSQLRRNGRVLRPYLGLKFVELDEAVAADLNALASERRGRGWGSRGGAGSVPSVGLHVMHVAPDSPAVADFLSYAYEKHRRATEQQRPHSLQYCRKSARPRALARQRQRPAPAFASA